MSGVNVWGLVAGTMVLYCKAGGKLGWRCLCCAAT